MDERKTLTSKERENLPESAFALPGRRYPIHDLAHARNALARVAQNGSPEEQAKVKAAVYRRYPQLKPERSEQLDLDERAFEPGEPDADDMGGPDDHDGDECATCDGTGKVEDEVCLDCGGTGIPKGESLMSGQSFNSAQEPHTAAWEARERRRMKAELMNGMPERRWWTPEWGDPRMELRSLNDGLVEAVGCASVMEHWYDVGDFKERMVLGAFKRSLGEGPDVVYLKNHGGEPLARTTTNSLFLGEEGREYQYNAHLQTRDPDVQSLLPKLERKDLRESSFAFRARDQEWDSDYRKRSVLDAGLHKGDVSVVNHGANAATTAGLRGLDDLFVELRGGRKNSKADRAEIEDTIKKLQALIAPEEDSEQVQTEEAKHAELKVSVQRAQLELAKARRRRIA